MGMGCLGAFCDKLCIKCMLDMKRPGMTVNSGSQSEPMNCDFFGNSNRGFHYS